MTDLRKAAEMALDVLESNKRNHHYCEDTWYSCPKHEDGCANDSIGDECICGADKANQQIDIAIAALRQALAQPEQEPVHFLANGVRYKVTHQGYYGCSIVGLPENLNGQWVALVEATDSKHLNCIAHQESTKPEQQPVAYLCENAVGYKYFRWKKPTSHYKPIALYTAPPSKPWVGLTDIEVGKYSDRLNGGDIAREVEAKLKERNT